MEEYKFGVGLAFVIFIIASAISLGLFVGFYWLISLIVGFKFSLIVPVVAWLIIFLLNLVVQIIGTKVSKGFLKQ